MPKTALLVMDMQMGILGSLPSAPALIERVAKVIKKAHEDNLMVIYVVVGFRAGTPEISLQNKGFAARKDQFASIDLNMFMKVHPDIAPQESDALVIKRRVSAFSGSDLEILLRAQGIQHLVLTGIATSGVVLSTLREAADKDFQITVIADCCADGDEEVHRVLTTKVFPRQAELVSSEDWLKN